MSALLPVQTAVYTKLSGDATFMTLSAGGVYDAVPQGALFPYTVVGEWTEIPENTHSSFGKEITGTLHIWSDAEGFAEALAILARADVLLDNQPLTVAGWNAWWVQNEFVQTLRENDGDRVLRHVVPRYRIQLHG